jgi:hypothetical protein
MYDVKGESIPATGGRRWKKSSQTQWKHYGKVRYSDCWGSLECSNMDCDFQKEYGVVNRSQFMKTSGTCNILWSTREVHSVSCKKIYCECRPQMSSLPLWQTHMSY